MMNKHVSNRKCYTNYSQSFSNLHHPNIMSLELKQYSLRKSYFNPPPGLEQSYATRNQIAQADAPVVQVLQSSKRWLLLQSPKLSQNLFPKINSGLITNPYEVLLHIFKGLATLAKIYGYFLVTPKMIWVRNKQTRVWINEDIFSNELQIPLKEGKQGETQFVLGFLLMLEREIKQWQRIKNIFTIKDTLKLLEQKSKIRRESLTAMLASKQVFHRPDQSSTSFQPNQLRYYSSGIKGCMSMQDIIFKSNLEELHEDMSSSYTIKEEPSLGFKKKVDKLLLYDEKNMKNSVYDQIKPPQASQEVRKTKKKFLTSTSSTLEKVSQTLLATMGRKFSRPNEVPVSLNTFNDKREPEHKKERQRRVQKAMHRSEPISIANELEGLFEEDKRHEFQLGVEGDREQLEKIAQEIEQVLIW